MTMMKKIQQKPCVLVVVVSILLAVVLHNIPQVSSFATPVSSSQSPAAKEAADLARSRLVEALSSPSGKLTLSPEIVIPEPTSPTAILLQTTEINSLSEDLRVKAKSNAVLLSCKSVTSLKTFCSEQEQVRGNFPGPLPIIYCSRKATGVDEAVEGGEEEDTPDVDLAEIADAGAAGIVVSVLDGKEIASIEDDLSSSEDDETWISQYRDALNHGIQPIPEIAVSDKVASTWKEAEIESIVSKIAEVAGDGKNPVSIMLSIKSSSSTTASTTDEDEDVAEDESKEVFELPSVPKKLGKTVPILASITTPAGENRLSEEVASLKKAGFTGAILRPECIPGFEKHGGNLNLEYLSNFWGACIGDLKSLKSKSFNFQSRNYMEKSVPLEWAKYQKSVLDSGALGDPNDMAPSPGFDADSGDYQGF
mmetsp:Transcript_29618/g.71622  ORF Transcript_29618/g.71622 Transcript_29618/m.71622 type:complete len:422 (-) Transcript_29618:165-1430(-)